MEDGPSNMLLQTLLILLLTIINAFFCASEFAIISLNKNRIHHLANEGNKKAALLAKLSSEPSKLLATVQVGMTLSGFLASASAAVSFSKPLEQLLRKLQIPFIVSASGQIALVTVTIALAFVTLVFGELLPKRIALQKSEKIAMWVVTPVLFVSKITAPFVKILTASTFFFGRAFGVTDENADEKITEEEIRMMIDVGEENGVLNETEKEMIDGILEFDNTLAKEIMTPRTNVFSMDINTPIHEFIDKILQEQYSRVPVYEEDVDNIIGIVYMKDLFYHLRKDELEKIDIPSILRLPYFVPETKNIDTLFRELQSSKNHMAILIDEYGGFSGILTMEDLIEEIVGNIADEYDEDDKSDEEIIQLDTHTYLVQGLTSIDDVNEELQLKLPSVHIDTIGGFVIDLLGNIPKENEEHVVEYENLVFTVEKITEKRVEQVKIYIQQEEKVEEDT